MPDAHFDPADAACWIAHGRKPEHAVLVAAAWRDFPDLPPCATLDARMARSRERIVAMRPVHEQMPRDCARAQEAANFAFTERQIRDGEGTKQDAAILLSRDRHGYGWLCAVEYTRGWYAADAGWDFKLPSPDLRGIIPAGTSEAYAQGFADGGGRRDDPFDTARRHFAAAGRSSPCRQIVSACSRPLSSEWPHPADLHRPVAWDRRLVILAATATRSAVLPSRAIDLLDDPLACEIVQMADTARTRLVILSGIHGFIDGYASRMS